MKLNVEEMNLLFLFDTSSREAAIQDILSRLPFVEDAELEDICEQTVLKLEQMTDDKFSALDFSVYKEDDDE